MDSGAQQDPSASDVHMDTGARTDAPDTVEDAGAGDKSAGTDKGKAPEVPEIRSDPAPASAGQATPAAPEQPTPKTPTVEKTTAPAKSSVPAKTSVPAKSSVLAKFGTLKIKQIITVCCHCSC
jgi:hypothetical protein